MRLVMDVEPVGEREVMRVGSFALVGRKIRFAPEESRLALPSGKRLRNLITVQEASDLSGLPVSTVRRLLRLGEIKGRKIGRRWMVSRSALEHFLGEDE